PIATEAINAKGPLTSAVYPEPDGVPTKVGPPLPLRVNRPMGGRGSSNGQHTGSGERFPSWHGFPIVLPLRPENGDQFKASGPTQWAKCCNVSLAGEELAAP